MSKQYAPRTHATRANYPNKQDRLGQLEVISRSHNRMNAFKCHRPTKKHGLSVPQCLAIHSQAPPLFYLPLAQMKSYTFC